MLTWNYGISSEISIFVVFETLSSFFFYHEVKTNGPDEILNLSVELYENISHSYFYLLTFWLNKTTRKGTFTFDKTYD